MPTREALQRFFHDWERLTPQQRAQFRVARRAFVEDLPSGKFRPSLRIKRVHGRRNRGIWEMTWADNGRATFAYGIEVRPGEAHVIWRRIGTHDIFADP